MHLARPGLQSRASRRFLLWGAVPLLVLSGLTLAHSTASAAFPVDARSNIFAAGRSILPAPAGGGGGVAPVEIALPDDAVSVTVWGVVGSATCCGASEGPNGADGGNNGRIGTDVLSFGGISGIRDAERFLFLTGVFLDANEPSGDAPERLDFGAAGLTDAFSELSPALRQTFFVGDGLTPSGEHQVFHVPSGASRLVLGFVDAFAFTGDPGYYDDNAGAFDIDSVSVARAVAENHDPDCSAAQAVEAKLWPPDGRLVPVSITGVTDADGDPVTILVTGVTQDEPLVEDGHRGWHGDGRRGCNNALSVGAGAEGPDGSAAGDDPDYDDEGHHADEQCPDAVVSATGDVSVRAERERYGNGRVYVVSFTATDGHGGSCAGSVSVCVPRRSSSTTCVDDGQQFNSLGECPQPEDPRRRWHHYGRDGVALTTTSQSGSRATLEYAIDEPSNILIGVYDIAGRRVATLFNGRQDAGVHQIDWVPGAAERGMYFCRLQAGSKVVTQSVLLLRR